MALLQELDTGTPIRAGDATVTLTIDGRQVSVPAGTSVMAAAALIDSADPEALRHRQSRGFRLLPAVPGRDRGPPRNARLLHDARRGGHGGPHPDAAAREAPARRDGALHLRPSARLPDLQRQRRLRIADAGRRVGLRDVRYGYDGANHLDGADRRLQPLFHLRIRRNASCARAACAPARRSRARSR